jgi:indole-3-glycerol phosphate synthase
LASTDFLTEIVANKRRRLEAAKTRNPIEQIRPLALAARARLTPHTLLKALQQNVRTNVIAEFKRRSPSRGVIRDDLGAETVARFYAEGGAAAISVLTEEDYFNGSLDDLRSVRNTVSLPILRKDFIVDEYQIYESAGAGADALLLIVAALNDDVLARLRQITEDELGMDALVEVHTKEEMRRALAIGARLIGVNNRNLKTFAVSLETSVELARESLGGALLISESGLVKPDDLRRLRQLGYRGFLIGESLMRAAAPDIALRTLLDNI